MKRSTRIAALLIRKVALACLCTTSAWSQLRQIDRSKLPQDTAVQNAYTDLLPIDQFAQTNEAAWRFPVPREQVTSRFLVALHTLEAAQQQDPDNKELQIFTGLVAHLAYNLGIEEAYGPALNLLRAQANDDFRAAWFLGIHQCQSNDPVGGMQRLLHVETSSASLPGTFWQDYANCAGVTNMPVHAIRAYDMAKKAADGPPVDDQQEQLVRSRIKPSSITESYLVRQAWHSEKIAGGSRFTSALCGESFATRSTSHLTIGDVSHATCAVSIDSEDYPSRYGPSTASLLFLTQAAKPGESLEAFSQRVLEAFTQRKVKDPRQADKTTLTGIQCPVAHCLSFEIVTNKLYKAEGGAHLLAVFFQSEQPEYPGLRFETPQPPPKSPSTAKSREPSPFRTDEVLQRFNGTFYSFVTLDANQDIYPRARADFDELLRSLVIDSK